MAPNNPISIWGNEKTMNLNSLILTNIQSSPYFKVQLYELKTYHEVIDEIYYKVEHLEPWEKGSRKTAGQTGMCGGVRGVGAGGIVSSAYCLLYKLFTLKLTRKQVIGLTTHPDSTYIRALGFMYIRYTQDPKDLWDWFEEYLDDEEELDVKAGGGHMMSIGELVRQWMTKIEWYCTLFPRVPVPVQKDIEQKLRTRPPKIRAIPEPQPQAPARAPPPKGRGEHLPNDEVSFGEAERRAHKKPPSPERRHLPSPNDQIHRRSPESKHRRKSPSDDRRRRPDDSKHKRRSLSPDRHRRRSPTHWSHRRSPHRSTTSQRKDDDDFSRELEREKERQRREKVIKGKPRSKSREKHSKNKHRSRSWSRERKHKRSKSPGVRRERHSYSSRLSPERNGEV